MAVSRDTSRLVESDFKSDCGPVSGAVSFGEAFRFYVKLGLISFGRPAGQIAISGRGLR
jgi:hypothetical protein